MQREGPSLLSDNLNARADVGSPQGRELLPVILHRAFQIDGASGFSKSHRASRIAMERGRGNLQFIELQLLAAVLIVAVGGQCEFWFLPDCRLTGLGREVRRVSDLKPVD